MHVYRTAQSSKRMRICDLSQSRGGGGRVYEIKNPHSNLAPEEGGGIYLRGAYN